MRPIHQKQIVREYFYVFAAVCPKKGEITALILPDCNTEMMNKFLKEVSRVYKNNHVIMQIDGAGWHTTKNLKIPFNTNYCSKLYIKCLNPVKEVK